MKKIRSPNRWSCLLASFATVLECSITELIEQIGHDGSEKIWPEFEEPNCRRGFHSQELIDCAWQMGYAITTFEAMPMLMSAFGRHKHGHTISIYSDPERIMKERIQNNIGVLTGQTKGGARHAFVIDQGDIWCASTGLNVDLTDFGIINFYVVSLISESFGHL